MDHVNDVLLLSLKQEIKTLNEVVENITLQCGESTEISSWLFPTKSCNFVNNLIKTGFAGFEDFRSYLELIVDRLYVGIRLILNYLDSIIEVEPSKNRLIRRPKQLTLGYSFQTLWTTISTRLIENMMTTNKETTNNNEDKTTVCVNKELQTDIIALNRCDSCSAAMLCMKNLLQSFENEKDGTIGSTRRLLRPKIYDITQFGCMLQTTTTIEKSLNTLFEKLFVKEQENELLRKENQKLKTEIANKFGKITLMEREVDILREKYEKDNFKIALLSSQNEDLLQMKTEQERQINTLEEIIKNLHSSIKCYKGRIQELGQDKENTQNLLSKISETKINLTEICLVVQEKCSVIESEQLCFGNSLNEMEHLVDSINNRLNTFSQIYNIVKNKIVIIHKNLEENLSFITSKSQDFMKCVKQHNLRISVYESRIPKENAKSFQIKGNPLEDLAGQIEENNEKIKQLQAENIKLENIIKKFRRIKK